MSAIELLIFSSVLYAFLLLVYNLRILKNTSNTNFIVLLCSLIVSNIGHFWLVSSNDLSESLVAIKVTYLGGLPMLLCIFLIICSVCKIKLKNIAILGLTFVTAVVLFMSFMIGENQLFYKTATYIRGNGYSQLTKEYGPLHQVYVVVLICFMLMSLGAAIYALFTPTLVSRSMAFILAMSETFAVISYFAIKVLKLGWDPSPIVYSILVTVDMFILHKVNLYDANRVSRQVDEANRTTAVILFDNNKRYLGSNIVARQLIEEIEHYNVERPISEKFAKKQFFEGLIEKLNESDSKNIYGGIYETDGEIYRIDAERLFKETKGTPIGYVIELTNDTGTQNYIRQISDMNESLDQAAKAANAASEAKSSFLANMSHEIRTPINAVLGLNSIILRDTKEEHTREYSEDINSAGRSLLALINDILDLSKIESGKMTIIPVEYKLRNLILDSQNMIYNRVSDKGLTFISDCDANVPSVLCGDEIRVRQILINLLTNAVKYTHAGSVTLSVKYEAISDDRINLIMSVKDTGIGISKENQKKLFDKFVRVDEEKNKSIEGTGLGLSLVQKLVALMDGEITVESEEGVGSEFKVRIPQDVVSNEPIGKISGAVERKKEVQAMDDLSETEGHILVVDDVKVNLKVFVNLLSKSKLDIVVSESGPDAIEKAKKSKFDIIFLDHMMPEMDGIETLHHIREDKDSPNVRTPVIMLTANAIDGVREQYLNEGFDDYLSKPVNYNPLRDMIKKYTK